MSDGEDGQATPHTKTYTLNMDALENALKETIKGQDDMLDALLSSIRPFFPAANVEDDAPIGPDGHPLQQAIDPPETCNFFMMGPPGT